HHAEAFSRGIERSNCSCLRAELLDDTIEKTPAHILNFIRLSQECRHIVKGTERVILLSKLRRLFCNTGLKIPVRAFQLASHLIEPCRQCAEFVHAVDRQPNAELTSCHAMQAIT